MQVRPVRRVQILEAQDDLAVARLAKRDVPSDGIYPSAMIKDATQGRCGGSGGRRRASIGRGGRRADERGRGILADVPGDEERSGVDDEVQRDENSRPQRGRRLPSGRGRRRASPENWMPSARPMAMGVSVVSARFAGLVNRLRNFSRNATATRPPAARNPQKTSRFGCPA